MGAVKLEQGQQRSRVDLQPLVIFIFARDAKLPEEVRQISRFSVLSKSRSTTRCAMRMFLASRKLMKYSEKCRSLQSRRRISSLGMTRKVVNDIAVTVATLRGWHAKHQTPTKVRGQGDRQHGCLARIRVHLQFHSALLNIENHFRLGTHRPGPHRKRRVTCARTNLKNRWAKSRKPGIGQTIRLPRRKFTADVHLGCS